MAEGLKNAIKQCSICVFLATPRSLESKWCLAELGAFWGAGKRGILYLADPNVKESDLPPQLQGNLWTTDALELTKTIRPSESDRLSRSVNGLAVSIDLGRIEECDCKAPDCLVALPANEYFDDECIHDSSSALGSFMNRHFPGQISFIQDLVKAQLDGRTAELVAKRPGTVSKSYGIGSCVYLENPLASNLRVALVAVTTQRADAGLCTDPIYIFEAARSLHRLMANHRLRKLVIPVFGSGHGGLKQELSILLTLAAFAELNRTRGTYRISELNIIVFRPTEATEVDMSVQTAKELLEFISLHLG